MAAPKGNQWWLKRSKHGRDKIFATPQIMWEAACEYFEWASKEKIADDKTKPYTLIGLCIFLDVTSSYFRTFKATIKGSDDPQRDDFLTVIGKIEEIIHNQQFEGATVGVFKENIIARSLGLHDTTNIQHSGAIDMPAPIIQVQGSGVPLASNENQVEVPEDKKEGEV